MKRSALTRKTPLAAARSSIQRKQRVSVKKADEKQRAIGRAKRAIKPKRKTLVAKLDTMLSLYVRARDRFCVICGTSENATNGHVFGRSHHSTRWSLVNNYQQCSSCNSRHNEDPSVYLGWYVLNFGQEALDALHREYWTGKKPADAELMTLVETIKGYEVPMDPPQYKRLPYVAWVNAADSIIDEMEESIKEYLERAREKLKSTAGGSELEEAA